MIFDFFAVVRSSRMTQVMFEIANGSGKLPKLETKQAAVAKLRDFFWVHHQHHVYNCEPFVERMGFQINLFQVVEHTPENLPVGHAREKTFVELNGVAVSLKESIAAVVTRQDLAPVERIEKKFFLPVRVFHNEVAGHSHADDRKIEASRNLHINRGQGDRNTDAAIQHVVEEAVSRIVIVLGCSAKPESFKQYSVDFSYPLNRRIGRIEPLLRDTGYIV